MSGVLTNPAWIAVIGTVFGGIALKFTEKWLNKSADNRSDRQDYRDEIKSLNERLDKVETELSTWRDRYYSAQEQILTLKAMMLGAGIKPPDE